MSDQNFNQKQPKPADWRPLIPEQDQDAHRTVSSGSRAARSIPDNELFRPLYEGDRPKENGNTFELIHGHSKKPASAEPPEPEPSAGQSQDKAPVPPEAAEQEMLENIRKEAHEQGFSQGKQEGYEAGMNEARQAVENLHRIMNSVENLWSTMVKRYENEMIELVKRIAEKVIYGHARIDNEIVKRAILKSFELIPDPTEATINVSSEDYEFIETAKEELFERIKTLKNVSIVSDPSIARGGCRVETRVGEVDSDIETRLEAISRSIIDAASDMAENK